MYTGHTEDTAAEKLKCASDPLHFCKRFVYAEEREFPLRLNRTQESSYHKIDSSNRVIIRTPDQYGKTYIEVGYLLWYAIFNPCSNVVITSPKLIESRNILERIKYAYDLLPDYLKVGVKKWNKSSCELSNGTNIICTFFEPTVLKGMSVSLWYCNELAHAKPNILVQREILKCVYPTLTHSKIIVISKKNDITPNVFDEYWAGGTKRFTRIDLCSMVPVHE